MYDGLCTFEDDQYEFPLFRRQRRRSLPIYKKLLPPIIYLETKSENH